MAISLQDEVSALHIAVHNGHVEAVEVLVHKMNKEDINARDNVSQLIHLIMFNIHSIKIVEIDLCMHMRTLRATLICLETLQFSQCTHPNHALRPVLRSQGILANHCHTIIMFNS